MQPSNDRTIELNAVRRDVAWRGVAWAAISV